MIARSARWPKPTLEMFSLQALRFKYERQTLQNQARRLKRKHRTCVHAPAEQKRILHESQIAWLARSQSLDPQKIASRTHKRIASAFKTASAMRFTKPRSTLKCTAHAKTDPQGIVCASPTHFRVRAQRITRVACAGAPRAAIQSTQASCSNGFGALRCNRRRRPRLLLHPL